MQFRTQISIPQSNNLIDYNSRVLSLGSCFAVNMGDKLHYFKFQNVTNPFGILFHPLALEKFINLSLSQHQFSENDIFFHNERWHCFDAHSDLSHLDKETLISNLTTACSLANAQLKQASHLIITLGTAWVYRHLESGNLVANCHKVPQKKFVKELLSTDDIAQSLQRIITMVQEANPAIHIVFTVSPVRHIKDGFVENQWSKANLISALHTVLKDTNAAYFPSYEIMMDELRDYRFYTSDMIHPDPVAIDYIWERFTDAYIDSNAQETMKQVDSIQKGLSHRPFNPQAAQHQDFLAKLNKKITLLQQQYPHITF